LKKTFFGTNAAANAEFLGPAPPTKIDRQMLHMSSLAYRYITEAI